MPYKERELYNLFVKYKKHIVFIPNYEKILRPCNPKYTLTIPKYISFDGLPYQAVLMYALLIEKYGGYGLGFYDSQYFASFFAEPKKVCTRWFRLLEKNEYIQRLADEPGFKFTINTSIKDYLTSDATALWIRDETDFGNVPILDFIEYNFGIDATLPCTPQGITDDSFRQQVVDCACALWNLDYDTTDLMLNLQEIYWCRNMKAPTTDLAPKFLRWCRRRYRRKSNQDIDHLTYLFHTHTPMPINELYEFHIISGNKAVQDIRKRFLSESHRLAKKGIPISDEDYIAYLHEQSSPDFWSSDKIVGYLKHYLQAMSNDFCLS